MQTIYKPKVSEVCFTDTETFSTVDIKSAGTVKYCESVELLLAGFLLDGQYGVYDFSQEGSVIPQWVLDHAANGGMFVAHNALFDYIVLAKHIPGLKVSQFIDTMAYAAAAGLPLSLAKCGYHLGIDEDKQKVKDGTRLVRKFCIPRKPTKYNKATRIYPADAPDDWIIFRDDYLYNDVFGMVELYNLLPGLSEYEQQVWVETQEDNLKGIPIDVHTCKLILGQLEQLIDDESSEFIRLTGLFPTQRDRVLGWCRANGAKIGNLQAATVQELMDDPDAPSVVKQALAHRANTTHMSFKKFPAMLAAAREDGTVGGTINYHTAHTGRFGGRLIQPHNLTRGTIDGNDAVGRILAGEFSVELVKSAVRPMIYHSSGMSIADYAQVEGRGVLWLCGDWDNLADFTGDQDPYKLLAVDIFNEHYDDIDDKMRFVGKQARLGLGYQMAWKKFMMTCANYGEDVHPDICKRAVSIFRAKHPKLVEFWADIEGAALMAMNYPGDQVRLNEHIVFGLDSDHRWLNMWLPSGRAIRYYQPNVSMGSWGETLSYMSMNDRNQYVRTDTYGGKLTENAVQGLCRDLLVHGLHNMREDNIRIITHVHDEVVAGTPNLSKVIEHITDLPRWADGFPLEAEGVVTPRYIKA